MAIFAIGDLHLSLGGAKPMSIFKGWHNHVERVQENWCKLVQDGDTVVICGDVSWGMSLEEALEDFRFIHKLPGKKIMLKGNHDYWWTTMTKMESFLQDNGLSSLQILHNNSYLVEGVAVCGSRGWIFEQGEVHDSKIVEREAGRLTTSLQSVTDESVRKIVFLHYPPVYGNEISEKIVDVMLNYGVKTCYYGHIHGIGHRYAIDGHYLDIDFHLIAADYLNFTLKKVE